MDEAKVKKLILDLLRLLMTYELELTAYSQVSQACRKQLAECGARFDVEAALQKISSDPRAHAEAKILYASCAHLLQSWTPPNLDAALAELKNLIAQRNQEPSLSPLDSDSGPAN
jgi:hypothetical protein